MNRYPLWKYLLIVLLVGLGFIYAAPNIFPPDPAIQVAGGNSQVIVNEGTLRQVEKALKDAGIEYFGEEVGDNRILLRLRSSEQQMEAKVVIDNLLDANYITALNRAATTPQWLVDIGAKPMSLGLDLSGGVHFLLEVDTKSMVKNRLESVENHLIEAFQKGDADYVGIERSDDGIMTIEFAGDDLRSRARSIVREDFPRLLQEVEDSAQGGYLLHLHMSEQEILEIEDYAVKQNIVTLRNRVNEVGVSEPIVQRQGVNRIIVELPGVQDPTTAKGILNKQATLEFRLQAESNAPVTQKVQYNMARSEGGGKVWLERRVIVTGDEVANASTNFDQQTGEPVVNITLDSNGGKKMHEATWKKVGTRMGVVFIETRYRDVPKLDAAGNPVLDANGLPEMDSEEYKHEEVINLAVIRSPLSSNFQISGLGGQGAAESLAVLLRAGALAAPMKFIEERTIGPSLGQENIDAGLLSVQIGLALVLGFMLVYYRVFGLAANIALALNLVLLVAFMSILGATLTLPGIAGIVLTVGMAVDANVLIFSRIKEEMKKGMGVQSSIKGGFDSAFSTILDANITTLIVAAILFAIGTGPVKGFAVTLMFGILTSMFTAIMGTRAIVNLMYGYRDAKKLWI